MGLRGQAPLIAAPAALLPGGGAVLPALAGIFLALGGLCALAILASLAVLVLLSGGLLGGVLGLLGLGGLLLALVGGLFALIAAALLLAAGQGQGPGGQQAGGGIHDDVAVQGVGAVELGAGHGVPGVHQRPGAHAPAGPLLPGGLDLSLRLHDLDGLGALHLGLGLAPASAAALFRAGLGLLQDFYSLGLLLLLGLALLLGRGLGGLVPGSALLPGGGPGLLVLLVDDAAMLVPLGGLEHLHGIGVVLHHGQLLSDQLFNVPQQGLLAKVAEGDGLAPPSGAARAANAVDIGLGHLGQVIVEHVGQLFNVQAPGGDVGGD